MLAVMTNKALNLHFPLAMFNFVILQTTLFKRNIQCYLAFEQDYMNYNPTMSTVRMS